MLLERRSGARKRLALRGCALFTLLPSSAPQYLTYASQWRARTSRSWRKTSSNVLSRPIRSLMIPTYRCCFFKQLVERGRPRSYWHASTVRFAGEFSHMSSTCVVSALVHLKNLHG